MTQDSYASDQEGASLSEDGLAIYWYFVDSCNRRGIPTRTRQQAQHDFKWKWAKVKAVMQEIEDAGYWQIADNATIRVSTDRIPPRPIPAWAEPEAPAALDPSRSLDALAGARNYLTTNHQSPTTTYETPSGGFSIRPRRMTKTYGTRSVVYELTEEFCFKVRKAYGGFAPDPINEGAVRASIRRWINEDGIPPEKIKAMIDLFVGQRLEYGEKPGGGAPVWKVFLAQRQRLLNMVENTTKKQRINDYWERAVNKEAGT